MNLDAIDRTKEPTMATESFTDSEILHAQTLGILSDEGKLDDHTAAEYEDALERAALLYGDTYAAANPSAAAEERRRIVRRLEVEKGSSS
jgi:hypothetical protein